MTGASPLQHPVPLSAARGAQRVNSVFYGFLDYRNILSFLRSLDNAHMYTEQIAYFKLS